MDLQCKWTVAALVAGAGAASLLGGVYLGYRAGKKARPKASKHDKL